MPETNFILLPNAEACGALTGTAINARAICAVVVDLINSDVGHAIGMLVFACAVTYILTQLKSAAVKTEAFTLKLLTALQSFALRIKQCCLNIRSYAKLYSNPTGLKIELGLNIGFAIRTFSRKNGNPPPSETDKASRPKKA